MKKTMKAILMATVIAILSLMATSAFAADLGNITWTHDGEGSYIFTYGGNSVDVGTTEIHNTNEAESLVYFDFDVEESGYYIIYPEKSSWLLVADEFEGSEARNSVDKECFYLDPEKCKFLFYLEEGETVLGVNFYDESSDKVTIEYYGEEIVDYTINEEVLDDFIIGWNVWENDPTYFCVCSDSVVTFSSGKIIEADDYYFEGVCDATPKEGTSKATIEFGGVEKEVEFTAHYLDSFVESAELSNIGRYTTVYEDYTGENEYVEISGETLTVKFTDGTEYVGIVDWNCADIVLPNGKEVNAYIGQYSYEDIFVIQIAGETVEEIECKVEGKMLGENINRLHEDNMETLRWSMNSLKNGFRWLAVDTEWAMDSFRWSVEEFVQIFRNIVRFVTYYTSLV